MTVLNKKTPSNLKTLLVILATLIASKPAQASDDYTIELYETYCMACHANAGAGVPVAFNQSDWDKKLANGLDKLINSAITGVGNMPAQGSCMECTYEDFEDLVTYMSEPQTDKQ